MNRLLRWLTALGALPCAAAAAPRDPQLLQGTLTLDLADPVVTLRIGDADLRLRVRLDQHRLIELNQEAVARTGIAFEAGPTDAVGPVDLASRVAAGRFRMNDRMVEATLSTHGRCCEGVDGAISALLLPYARIHLRRAVPVEGAEVRSFVLTQNDDDGLGLRVTTASRPIRFTFSLDRQETLATAAAGSILATANGGVFAGGYGPVPVAFGISRPSRVIAFGRPVDLAGFTYTRLRVRTADYGGRYVLPREAAAAGDIVVDRKVVPQGARAVVAIGRDRLDGCDEMLFSPEALVLTLHCTFDRGAP